MYNEPAIESVLCMPCFAQSSGLAEDTNDHLSL